MEAKKATLYQHVNFLTSLYPYRNYRNIESLNRAADYIEDALEKTGFPTSRQIWEAEGHSYQNIIAAYRPEKPQRFIIGAHYDVYKDSPGADDNASSVAGLLELARMLSESNLELDYGIDFVSYCLEEPPFFKKKEMGSYVHADSLDVKNTEYLGMIALEMIGYYHEKNSDSDKKSLIVSGIERYDDFNKRISKLLRVRRTIDSARFTHADTDKNNGPSDHRNYWKYDIPAVMVIGTGGGGNPNYHTITDTIETLDFDTMTEAVNCLAYALFNF